MKKKNKTTLFAKQNSLQGIISRGSWLPEIRTLQKLVPLRLRSLTPSAASTAFSVFQPWHLGGVQGEGRTQSGRSKLHPN